jgi:glucose-6-phosphate 1-dehydrogenase
VNATNRSGIDRSMDSIGRHDGMERLSEISAPLIDHPRPPERGAPGPGNADSIRRLVAPHRWHLPAPT